MLAWPFKARETDATDTRASLATSLIVTATMPPAAGSVKTAFAAPECNRFHRRLQKHCNMPVIA
jgi:hypothetical protein